MRARLITADGCIRDLNISSDEYRSSIFMPLYRMCRTADIGTYYLRGNEIDKYYLPQKREYVYSGITHIDGVKTYLYEEKL